MFNNIFPKFVSFVRYVQKYGVTRQATDHTTIWHRKDAICMPDNYGKNTDTHS